MMFLDSENIPWKTIVNDLGEFWAQVALVYFIGKYWIKL